ncbi:hypothetical protein CAPTEDRAFT_63150, partial [Capitella teleta]
IRRNLLIILLISALGIGIGVGAAVRGANLTRRERMYFAFPGDILMRMLKALIIPLVVSSLISGLAGLDTKSSGRMGLYAIVYYFTTTLLAVLLGILLVSTIKPGVRTDVEDGNFGETANVVDSFLDLIRYRYITVNITANCSYINTTFYDECIYTNTSNNSEETLFSMLTHVHEFVAAWYDFEVRKEEGMNILGLVVWSVAMGIVVSKLGEQGRILYKFFYAFAEATMKLVTVVIWYSPIGIMFLVAAEIIEMEDPVKELEALGLYIATVMAGLAIHGLIVIPLIYLIITRKNPFKYLYHVLQALITALGTASSAATLPVTYRCLEVNNGLDPRVTRFVLPVGATINMDGTALYEAVAAVFIAQTRGMSLSAVEIITISITATLASIGAASVPQAGLVTMIIVLTSIGLPAEDVS